MDVITTLFIIIIIIFSVIIHELAHGYAAYALGDPTAKYAGRLTINPLPHLDLFGSIILPITMALLPGGIIFGWAKPVPINPYNFKDQTWGSLKVALAGPLTNLGVAIFFGLILRFLPLTPQNPFSLFLSLIVFYNLLLTIFNLIPIPPLDGHWILFAFLPRGTEAIQRFLHQYGIFFLLFLIFFGGLQWITVAIFTLFSLITGMTY